MNPPFYLPFVLHFVVLGIIVNSRRYPFIPGRLRTDSQYHLGDAGSPYADRVTTIR